MITVEVRVFATLRQYRPENAPGEPFRLSVPDGTTVDALIEKELGIPGTVVKQVFVNGAVRRGCHTLGDGDRVGIFPPIAGG